MCDTSLFLLSDVENLFNQKSGGILIQTSDYKIYGYDKCQDKLKVLPFNSDIGYINDIGFMKGQFFLVQTKDCICTILKMKLFR